MAQIRVPDDMAEHLHDLKERGESYADVLVRVYGVGKDE